MKLLIFIATWVVCVLYNAKISSKIAKSNPLGFIGKIATSFIVSILATLILIFF